MLKWKIEFSGDLFENVGHHVHSNFSLFSKYMPVAIKHFLPSNDSLKEKDTWYDNLSKFFNCKGDRPVDNFDLWKTRNPHGDNFV
jgi:hypothetical protein